MSKSQTQYEIEDDARSLVNAEVIKKDTKRFAAAVAHQKKINKAGEEAIKK